MINTDIDIIDLLFLTIQNNERNDAQ